MNRKYIALLGNSLVGSAIIAAILVGFNGAVIWAFCGGLSQIADGMKAPGDGVEIIKGIAKIMCSGTIVVAALVVIKNLIDCLDWIHGWRLGR